MRLTVARNPSSPTPRSTSGTPTRAASDAHCAQLAAGTDRLVKDDDFRAVRPPGETCRRPGRVALGRQRCGGGPGGAGRTVEGVSDDLLRPVAETVFTTAGLAQDLIDEGVRRLRRGIAGNGDGPGIVRPDRAAACGQHHCGNDGNCGATQVDMDHCRALSREFVACFQWVHNKQQLRFRHSR